MKVSRVNHTKSAIGIKNGKNEVGGILYEIPSDKPNIDLAKRLKSQVNAAQKLYNIFVSIQVGKIPEEPSREGLSEEAFQKKLSRYEVKIKNYNRREKVSRVLNPKREDKNRPVNLIVKNILFHFVETEKNGRIKKDYDAVNENEVVLENIANEKNQISESEDLVALALRKSLRDNSDGAIALLKNLGNKNISESDKVIICAFVDAVRKDFNKNSGSSAACVIRSLENQNLIVQPNQEKFTMPIPQQNGKKKEYKFNEKTGFEEFLSIYADLNTENRINLLRKLRRIISLYFTGGFDKSQFNVWGAHEDGKLLKGTFVDIPEILLIKKEKKVVDKVKETNAINELDRNIREKNISCYRNTRAVVEKDNEGCFFDNLNINMFWIHHIENAVERILSYRLSDCLFKLDNAYLMEKIWKDALNAMSIKYIAMGKSVYNFGLNDLNKNGAIINLGAVDSEVNKNITSFDYEMIKARETLQRELAVAIAFAANNLARATVDIEKAVSEKGEMDDFLLWGKDDIKKYSKYSDEDEMLRSELQFFGGKSNWKDNISIFSQNAEDSYDVLRKLQQSVYSLRNDNFHFVTYSHKNESDALLGEMFENEAKQCVRFECDKIYSNNLPKFYSSENLEQTMNLMYGNKSGRAAQVPAFNNVVTRKNFAAFLNDTLKYRVNGFDSIATEEWQNALYYLFKELYYNSFLQSDSAKQLFVNAAQNIKPDGSLNENEKKHHDAVVKNFRERINEISKKRSLSEICQLIMTEYNYQNSQTRTVKSGPDSLFDKTLFKHYKLFLLKALASAFGSYIIGEPKLKYLANPELKQLMSRGEFLPNWTSNKYNAMVTLVKSDSYLQKWYVAGRLLNPKSLSLIAGTMRSYLQFVGDIKKRASSTRNKLHINEDANVERISNAVDIIDMCIILSGGYSLKFEDYFSDVEEYAKYLADFVEYEKEGTNVSYLGSLKDFCYSDNRKYIVYVDEGKNPIFNRNVLQAKLYGPENVVKRVVDKVTSKELDVYYKQGAKVQQNRIKSTCTSGTDQAEILKYQRMKNRIELRDIAEYGEVINDLLGQLINWSFIRERDLLYYQLGFHYYCLQNDTQKPVEYSKICGENKTINNAILYQIMGTYVNGIGVYSPVDGVWKENALNGSVGRKCRQLEKYGKAINIDELYESGLEIFENLKEHNDIINVRNAIDHFKYYSGNVGSILHLYSEVFDRFFTYDMKYQKNVVNMLSNILLRHKVIISPALGKGKKTINGGEIEKDAAQICVTKIGSERFTYACAKESLDIDAKSEIYLRTIAKLLVLFDDESETAVIECKKNKITAKQEEKTSKGSDKNSNVQKKGNMNQNNKGKEHYSKNYRPNYDNKSGFGNSVMSNALKDFKLNK